MSKRCELQKEYYQQYGNYKGNGKYCNKYVSWLENEVLALRQPLVIKSVCEKYPKPTQRYCYECEGCKKAMSEQTDGKPPVMCCGLTEVEFTERERLLELQRSRTRWFSQQEFDRLKELSEKMFANAGSPHST